LRIVVVIVPVGALIESIESASATVTEGLLVQCVYYETIALAANATGAAWWALAKFG
jgi:hypothetical protein